MPRILRCELNSGPEDIAHPGRDDIPIIVYELDNSCAQQRIASMPRNANDSANILLKAVEGAEYGRLGKGERCRDSIRRAIR